MQIGSTVKEINFKEQIIIIVMLPINVIALEHLTHKHLLFREKQDRERKVDKV